MGRLFVAGLLVSTLASGALAAPTLIGTYQGHKYYVVDAGTVSSARAAAVTLGQSEGAPAYLATLNDAAEETWIRQQLQNPEEQLWIGFSDEVAEGTFVWDNGEPVTYTHWVYSEPTDFGFCPTTGSTCPCEDNVTLNGHPNTGGGWNDLAGECWSFRGLVEVNGVSNRPPDCSLAVASEPVLWPPDHTYHRISILGVTDPNGDPMTITVTGITQDEPLNTRGDGNTCPDAQIAGSDALLRAERAGTAGAPGNGRVYAVSFVAEDDHGGQCSGRVLVCVPHDRSGSACLDDGQRYLSTGDCSRGNELQVDAEYGLQASEAAGRLTVAFSLPAEANVSIGVFDVTGRRMGTVESGSFSQGVHGSTWNMSALPKGLYFVRMRTGATTLTRAVLKTR